MNVLTRQGQKYILDNDFVSGTLLVCQWIVWLRRQLLMSRHKDLRMNRTISVGNEHCT